MRKANLIRQRCFEHALAMVQREIETVPGYEGSVALQRLRAAANAFFQWWYIERHPAEEKPSPGEKSRKAWTILDRYRLDPQEWGEALIWLIIRGLDAVDAHVQSLLEWRGDSTALKRSILRTLRTNPVLVRRADRVRGLVVNLAPISTLHDVLQAGPPEALALYFLVLLERCLQLGA